MTDLDVAFVPTPKKIVQAMLRLASLRRGETLFDLGAGDGRVIIEAARRFGANAIGVEIDPRNISRIKERLATTGTKASLIEANMFEINLTSADVITIYLSTSANARLAPKLTAELKPGARIVSLDYSLPGWVAKQELQVEASGIERTIYLYKKT
jgi:ubiquinone/menaquinone biosynthesis C-methylase UbiE